MRGLPLKAFPLGGRWHGEAVTDEGAMIERFFVGPDALIGPLDGSFRRGFRRLRAASFFPSDGKETNGPGHPLLPLRGNSP